MEKEFKTEEVQAVLDALVQAYNEKQAGCTAADVAAAAGLSEGVVRACLEYLRQTGKVERAGELYVPAGEANAPKAAVEMTSCRYGTRSPVAMPRGDIRFSRQSASNFSEEDKEAVYKAVVEICSEPDKEGFATVGEVADKARSVGSMQKIGQILRALWDDNRVDRGRKKRKKWAFEKEVWWPM
jgi:hypothetical protein